jgi:hypothetical protein
MGGTDVCVNAQHPGPRLPRGTCEGPECYQLQEAHEKIPLAHGEPVMLVATPNVEQPQIQDTTLKLNNMTATARTNLSDTESWELEELLTNLCYEQRWLWLEWQSVQTYTYGRGLIESPTLEEAAPPPFAKGVDVGEMLAHMQQCGVIEESTAPGHPVFAWRRTGTSTNARTTGNWMT